MRYLRNLPAVAIIAISTLSATAAPVETPFDHGNAALFTMHSTTDTNTITTAMITSVCDCSSAGYARHCFPTAVTGSAEYHASLPVSIVASKSPPAQAATATRAPPGPSASAPTAGTTGQQAPTAIPTYTTPADPLSSHEPSAPGTCTQINIIVNITIVVPSPPPNEGMSAFVRWQGISQIASSPIAIVGIGIATFIGCMQLP